MRRLGGERRRGVTKHRPVDRDSAAYQPLRPDQGAKIARVGRLWLSGDGLQRDVAFALGQRAVGLPVEVDLRATRRPDHQPRDVGEAFGITSVGRGPGIGAKVGRAEAAAEDDVDHPLVGRIAVLERDLLGQNFETLERLGRQVAHFLEARDALAVEQHHRPAAATAAPARAAHLGAERRQQFGDARRPGRANVADAEHIFRWNVAHHRPARLLPYDNDFFSRIALIG